MERTNFFLGLIFSFFSSKFYREVAKSWRGRSFVALAILLAIFWIVLTFVGGVLLISHGKKLSDEIVLQMPVITIQNGLASTAEKKPTIISIFEAKSQEKIPFAIIDTHNQFSNFDQSKAIILVTQKEVIVKQNKNESKQYQFTKKYDGVFGPSNAQKLSHKLLFIMTPIVLGLFAIIVFTVSYAFAMFLALIFALIGWVIALLMSREVHYWGIYHIALIALLPAITVSFILALMMAFSWWVLVGIMGLYMLFGICVLPRKLENFSDK